MMSRMPIVDSHLELLAAEIGEALAWYDAIGPAEAMAQVMAEKAALLCVLSLDGFDTSAATKH